MEPSLTTDWYRLYGGSWKGAIEDDSFAHPAKFSRGLIRYIIDHAMEEGWLRSGDTVLDPFGGVALGALHATTKRLNWVGMELEERFVLMGNRNIQRWENLFRAGGYTHGSAYLYHGDSRYLALLLDRRVNGCVSSPPYASGCAHTGGSDPHPEHIQGGVYHGVGLNGAISSPPYSGNEKSDYTHEQRDERRLGEGFTGRGRGCFRGSETYGRGSGQLGAMPEGQFQAAVSSPPYAHPAKGISVGEMDKKMRRINEARLNRGDIKGGIGRSGRLGVSIAAPDGYGTANGQLGTERGDTFWTAARQVIEQVYHVLAPGAHAIWVCKDFVRKGERVPFTHRWAELCVSCGFEWLREHRAWVVEEYGTQLGFLEDKPIVKERKSFFRRLAEKNGSPHIDWESVLCFMRMEL